MLIKNDNKELLAVLRLKVGNRVFFPLLYSGTKAVKSLSDMTKFALMGLTTLEISFIKGRKAL